MKDWGPGRAEDNLDLPETQSCWISAAPIAVEASDRGAITVPGLEMLLGPSPVVHLVLAR